MSFLWPRLPPAGIVVSQAERESANARPVKRNATHKIDEILELEKGVEHYDIPFSTIAQEFRNIVAKFPDAPSQCSQANSNAPFVAQTWTQHLAECEAFGKALIAVGCESRSCVAIKGFNHARWTQAFLGASLANVVPAGIYPTNGPEATWYILDHTDSKVVIVDTVAHAEGVLALKSRLPKMTHVVVYMQDEESKVHSSLRGKGVLPWTDFLKLGASVTAEQLAEREAQLHPSLPCVLVYTSGTTGNPKGCLISHDAGMFHAKSLLACLDLQHTDRMVSFLPLSHIAACLMDILLPLATGHAMYYAQPDVLKGSLLKTLTDVRPTLFLGVPRVWEKVQEGLSAASRNGPAFMRFLTSYTKPATMAAVDSVLFKGEGFGVFPSIVDATINKAIKKKLGFDQCRIFASGAAPLAKHTQEFFLQLGMPICDIMGMTESSGLVAKSQPIHGAIKLGSCGRAWHGTELTLIDVDAEGNGELAFRSRGRLLGYYKDEIATKAAITEDGFFRTGDISKIDEDGFLFITGRSKELIITAGGENVAPVPIEDAIKKQLPRVVSNVMVIGDMKKFLSCVLTLKLANPATDAETLAADLVKFFEENGIEGVSTVAQAKASAAVKKLIEAGIKAANAEAVSRAQCVQKFTILDGDFSEEGGELTATMKLKRAPTVKKYTAEIDAMYPEDQN